MDRINNYAQGVSEIATLESIRNNLGVEASEYTPDESQPERDRVFTFAQQEKVLSILADIETGVANLVEKADTNAENIATNTANIAQNTTDIDIADKRITNIEKLLQGNLYDYQTDSSSAYTKTVPQGAMPYASLNEVGGKTVVWNQLCQNEKPTSTVNDVTFTNNGDGSWTINGTATAGSNKPFSTFATVSGHKYYIKACPSGGSGTTYFANISGLGISDMGNGAITTINLSANLNLRLEFSTGVTFDNVKIYPQCVDLTLLYGSGNEPSTVAEFQQMFPADYYAYNEGTLLSAGVTEVISNSKNLVNQDEMIGTVTGATQGDGYWSVSDGQLKTAYSLDSYATNSGSIFNQPSLTLSFDVRLNSIEATGSTFTYGFIKDGGETQKGAVVLNDTWQHCTCTITSNTACKVGFGYVSSRRVDIKNFQLEANSAETAYSPYGVIATYPIPTAIRNLEGYGWSAGSVYNYIDYERKVFVKNVVSVTYNGTEDWEKQTDINNPYYYLKVGNNGDVVDHKVVCDSFETVTIAGTNTNVGIDVINSSGYNAARILIRRADMSGSKDDFKTWLASNNITVNYALSTPQEIDISAYLTDDNLISVEAGGTLTFPNSNGDDYRIPVPSAETYMVDLQEAIGG